MRDPSRWSVLLAAAWLGMLLAVAAIGTPAAFALLPGGQAGPVAGRMLGVEAAASLGLGAVLALLQRARSRRETPPHDSAAEGSRSAFTPELGLALGALSCTVAGYYGVLPLMEEARAGRGAWSFGQLHAASAAFYGLKVALVAALAWRASARPMQGGRAGSGG